MNCLAYTSTGTNQNFALVLFMNIKTAAMESSNFLLDVKVLILMQQKIKCWIIILM